MTDDAMRVQIEHMARGRLGLTPCEGSKPEHFGFYAERVHGGFATVAKLCMFPEGAFRAAAQMFLLYYEQFTQDNDDMRLINRMCLDVMAKGASRPTAWEVALSYHATVRAKVGPQFNLDNYTVVVMTEDEVTPEVLEALVQKHNDNGREH